MNIIRKVFGALALLIGVSIIAWVLFNLLVDRQTEFKWHWWQGFGASIPFIVIGWHWIRTPPGQRNESEFNEEDREKGSAF